MMTSIAGGSRSAGPPAPSVAIIGDDRLLMRALFVVARRLGIRATTGGHHDASPEFIILALKTLVGGARRSAAELATASRDALTPFQGQRRGRLIATLRFATDLTDGDARRTGGSVREGLVGTVGLGVTVIAVRGSSLRRIARTAHVVLRAVIRMMRP